jgi:hypothetical protein
MDKGKIIFYDDQPEFTSQFEALMQDSGFKIVTFTDIDKLREALKNQQLMSETKALIFDLARNQQESNQTRDFEILRDIEEQFHTYRIPIFIHSAFASQITNFDNKGTVWKIDKSGTSLSNIVDIIGKLDRAGFMDAFTPGGVIEQNLMQELHKSFTEQFRIGEIEKIIQTLEHDDPEEFRTRAIEVFRRVAVRSLLSVVNAPIISDKGSVNPIEHYYRRISKVDFWTGDILKSKKDKIHLMIITPRCNVASKGYSHLLVCEVEVGTFPKETGSKDGRKEIGYALNDKPEVAGYNRYLPPSPIFEGGKVVLSKYQMLHKDELKENFYVLLSLSDELTNEILGKFGAYFFRSGISPWNQNEVIKQVNQA